MSQRYPGLLWAEGAQGIAVGWISGSWQGLSALTWTMSPGQDSSSLPQTYHFFPTMAGMLGLGVTVINSSI